MSPSRPSVSYLLLTCLLALLVAGCGTPKPPADAESEKAKTGQGQEDANENQRLTFQQRCDQARGHYLKDGKYCRLRVSSVFWEKLPEENGRPVTPPWDYTLGEFEAPVELLSSVEPNSNSKVSLWNARTGQHLRFLGSWDGYLKLPAGVYKLTIQSRTVKNVELSAEGCLAQNLKFVDCDGL